MGGGSKGNKEKQKQKEKAKDKKKKEKKKKKEIITNKYLRLIDRLSNDDDDDDDGEEVKCAVPSDLKLDEMGFLTPKVENRSITSLKGDLPLRFGYFGLAFYYCAKEDKEKGLINFDSDDENLFSKLEMDKQLMYQRRIHEGVRRMWREEEYRRWLYAMVRYGVEEENEVEAVEGEAQGNEVEATEEGIGVAAEEGNEVAKEAMEEEEQGNEAEVAEEGIGVAAEEGNEVAKEAMEEEEQGNEKAKKEEESDVVVVWEGEDRFRAVGSCPFQGKRYHAPLTSIDHRTTLVDFPMYIDGDVIDCYDSDFSLASWYKIHMHRDSRWLSTYGFDKPRRELLAIIQSLIICLLDFKLGDVLMGNLTDMRNYKISQYVENHAGSKKAKFKTVLVSASENLIENEGKIEHFLAVLSKLLEGGTLDPELERVADMLQIGWENPKGWVAMVLRDFPGLWDVNDRISFYLNLCNLYINDMGMKTQIKKCFKAANYFYPSLSTNWQANIMAGSVFDHILRYPIVEGDDPDNPTVKYNDSSIGSMMKYIRNIFLHYRDTQGGHRLDKQYVERVTSTIIFSGLLLKMYSGMCARNIFLS